jgi:hypothetical protein
MDDTAVVATWEGIQSSVAALGVVIHGAGDPSGTAVAARADPQAGVDRGSGADPQAGVDPGSSVDPGSGAGPRSGADFGDPLRDQADAYLDGLAGLARVEAQVAALKVQLAAGYATVAEAPGGAGLFCAGAHCPEDGGDR